MHLDWLSLDKARPLLLSSTIRTVLRALVWDVLLVPSVIHKDDDVMAAI